MGNHFCAMINLVRHADGRYELPGVTARRFQNEAKFPGGTNKNSPWEDPAQTLIREAMEETGLKPISYKLIHKDEKPGHTKYFFVCLKVEGQFDGPKTVKEPDGDELEVRMWDLDDFDRHLFRNHRPAFMKVCRTLRDADSSFSNNYPEICRKLDE
jgi:ADP-ribose pyrophosphatase YjhB (NUDIX family)